MRKVYVLVTTRIIMEVNEGQEIHEVIQEMDFNFTPSPDQNVDFVDMEIRDFEIVDSK